MNEDMTSAQMDALQEPTMTEPLDVMTANLRRLAEQAAANGQSWLTADDFAGFGEVDTAYLIAANPQAILALLDERDRWKKEATVRAGQTALFRRERDAAERRVAALEEGLRDLWECWDTGQDDDVLDVHFQAARALLAAAPSEPPDEYMCPNCVTPWKCNGPHIPAALRLLAIFFLVAVAAVTQP